MSDIKIRCAFTRMVPIDELRPHPKNRNKHPKEQIDRLAHIFQYQGVRHPIKVSNLSGFITAGHGRLEAANKLGMKQFPVDFQDYESEEQEYADIQSDNAIVLWAELDLSCINSDMGELVPDFDIDLLGIKDFTLDLVEKLEPQCDEGDVPECVEPKAKRGDIYKLGNHRLMCGDSTSIDDVERLMDGERAELCFTSPPYSDQREYGGGLDLSTEHLATFIRVSFSHVNYFAVNLGYSRKNGEVNPYWDDYIKEAKHAGLKLLSWNIWDKGHCGSIGNQTAMFGIRHEWIFVFGEKLKELKRTIPNINAGYFQDHNYIRNADGSTSKGFEGKINTHKQLETIILQSPQMARDGINHPARFPVGLPEQYIEAMTAIKECVYEPFGGSGSTLIACEKTNRKCYGMELNPHYVDLIIARWEKYTGKKAELITEDK